MWGLILKYYLDEIQLQGINDVFQLRKVCNDESKYDYRWIGNLDWIVKVLFLVILEWMGKNVRTSDQVCQSQSINLRPDFPFMKQER
jgi:hypothetical protein